MKLAPYDELNVLREKIGGVAESSRLTPAEMRDTFSDWVLDILIMSYLYGTDDAAELLGIDIDNFRADPDRMSDAIFLDVAGENFRQRIDRYVDDEGEVNVPAILRVAEAEMTRDYNQGGLDTANASGFQVMKTWNTMMDERVRETHQWLEGVTIPLNDRFYTPDGDSALGPGGFSQADNNVGCRCWMTYRRA